MLCAHCYCLRVEVGGRPHVQCCNCGHKKLDPRAPTEYAVYREALAAGRFVEDPRD